MFMWVECAVCRHFRCALLCELLVPGSQCQRFCPQLYRGCTVAPPVVQLCFRQSLQSGTDGAYRTLTTQERFPAAYTVDISVGKIFYLPGRQSVNFNLSVNNLLNKKDICTGGYEQGRSDLSYPTRFGGKYYYMQGLNCFLNVSYRF